MNGTGNYRGNGAKAVPLYRLLDKDGIAFGPYESAAAAAAMARELWPDQEQDEERSGKGWDIEIVGS